MWRRLGEEVWRGGGSRKKGVVENCEKIGARGVEVLCRASACGGGCTCNFQTFGKCVCNQKGGGQLSPSPQPAVKITQSEEVNHSCDSRVYAH